MIFTLDTEEFNKAQSKNSLTNKLAFAVMLKFFQMEKHYPTNTDFIDQGLIDSLAIQLNCHNINLNNYDWNNRTTMRFRKEISMLLGYRRMTIADSNILIVWLIDNILSEAPSQVGCQVYAYEFLAKNKIEPCTAPQLERYINTAYYNFEKQFFTNIFKKLSVSTTESIDSLLEDNSELDTIKIVESFDEKEELIGNFTQVKLVH